MLELALDAGVAQDLAIFVVATLITIFGLALRILRQRRAHGEKTAELDAKAAALEAKLSASEEVLECVFQVLDKHQHGEAISQAFLEVEQSAPAQDLLHRLVAFGKVDP